MNHFRLTFLSLLLSLSLSAQSLRILNFQGDTGYRHESQQAAKEMMSGLGRLHGWEILHLRESARITDEFLADIDVVIFNNNCGSEGPIFDAASAMALQRYVRGGGGWVGIHCAGAIRREAPDFLRWYRGLVGATFGGHPELQEATVGVEHHGHPATAALPDSMDFTDEWYFFEQSPRDRVNVLMSLDERTFSAPEKFRMGKDHPVTWYHHYDGGRAFFTALGHRPEVYRRADFQHMITGGIRWAAGYAAGHRLPVNNGLMVDLDARQGGQTNQRGRVVAWKNQVAGSPVQSFLPNDYGVRLSNPGSGRPRLVKTSTGSAVSFAEDELINEQEDALDHLMRGSGYTWLVVLKPYPTADPEGMTALGQSRLRDVNSFLGNLRNGGNYAGIWGCLEDDLTVWCGSRNGITFGRFDDNNPKVTGPQLEAGKFYVLAGRMGSGPGTVAIDLFVNAANPVASGRVPVNPRANPSRLAIGTERDATNHPGAESFDGEIARILIYERPLSDVELGRIMDMLRVQYEIKD
ncbi:ThuA domain-containing protein [Lewinella sp. W8]|uniref:ThuA domain-containing protein n=1 Tax=Lewinella sp. W8 TaxID=2528208 RepID=UPI00106844B4|nr:ThuA domain-containing protein [Lewinella sp. W8]MTB51411.1 hypothetical protein [Lewinella sp. W8]